jgi:hypothetical protein
MFSTGIDTRGQLIVQDVMNMLNSAGLASLLFQQFLAVHIPDVADHGEVAQLLSILK